MKKGMFMTSGIIGALIIFLVISIFIADKTNKTYRLEENTTLLTDINKVVWDTEYISLYYEKALDISITQAKSDSNILTTKNCGSISYNSETVYLIANKENLCNIEKDKLKNSFFNKIVENFNYYNQEIQKNSEYKLKNEDFLLSIQNEDITLNSKSGIELEISSSEKILKKEYTITHSKPFSLTIHLDFFEEYSTTISSLKLLISCQQKNDNIQECAKTKDYSFKLTQINKETYKLKDTKNNLELFISI